ncbi:MAG: RsmB/NOP family class I SAM-dependent RNA methyltransferase [Candidatus Bathyarchaeota archaeon]|uniref:RsmB/NOP family class I SAM-dependent RNA methyltransferase n=1 Tax=Candidatus Bathycorpusculum sp. TaxID=2994959 RepID=UPI00282F12F8|nr:RsmB/NOP family class I SAM-dependent RNA methyltransferase [Candidatus Termiticorpusculum sp.]MCL2258104.1 RsmB/NOP family class I SAM-dependent RNA methyltransferase [Candidatus Termiticorpusculum sp.]MCL2291638.1 RsmB/NOP family class I SAM-dependent RNA methyltransferase [Candidatus Termiticorpusculum sp.]
MEGFYFSFYLLSVMSGREFFVSRYEQLGWKYRPVNLRQAIRFNQLNSSSNSIGRQDLVLRLSSLGLNLETIDFLSSGFWVCNSKVSAGATAEYLLGLYSIQEAAAQIPVSLFSNLRGKRVLDASAAPGGKTVQLANAMDNTGSIVALDINKQRLAALTNHLERCHVTNTIVYQLDARNSPKLGLKFDCILVDAPCSGNFASDNNWFQNRTQTDIERNARLQREILMKTAECLTDNGEIIYSTCSLEPEENELNINWAIQKLNIQPVKITCPGTSGLTNVFGKQLDPSITHSRRFWPNTTQGFYICKLARCPHEN